MDLKQKRNVMGAEPPKAVPAPDRTDQMSFLEHLEELRWRLIKGIGGILLGVIIAAVFNDFIIDIVLLGPTKANFFMYDIIRVDSIDLITRFCNNLSLNMEQVKEIIIIAEKFTDKYYSELSSCTPGSLAASFIYYYVNIKNIKISKKDISENTNISVVTIQKIVSLLNNL